MIVQENSYFHFISFLVISIPRFITSITISGLRVRCAIFLIEVDARYALDILELFITVCVENL